MVIVRGILRLKNFLSFIKMFRDIRSLLLMLNSFRKIVNKMNKIIEVGI